MQGVLGRRTSANCTVHFVESTPHGRDARATCEHQMSGNAEGGWSPTSDQLATDVRRVAPEKPDGTIAGCVVPSGGTHFRETSCGQAAAGRLGAPGAGPHAAVGIGLSTPLANTVGGTLTRVPRARVVVGVTHFPSPCCRCRVLPPIRATRPYLRARRRESWRRVAESPPRPWRETAGRGGPPRLQHRTRA